MNIFSLCCKIWCLDVCVTSALDIGLVSCAPVLCGYVLYEFMHTVLSIPMSTNCCSILKERTEILSWSCEPSCRDILWPVLSVYLTCTN